MKTSIKQKNIGNYNKTYIYDEVNMAYEIQDKLQIISSINILFKNLKKKKVLDIGFGTGDILKTFFDKGAECYGIEISEEAINYLKRKMNGKYKLTKGDISCLPYRSEYFDIIVCSHVLEHVKDDKKAISEIKRVLKKNGLAAIGVPSVGNKHSFMHYREYSINQFKKLVVDWDVLFFKPYGSKLFQLIFKVRNYLTYSLIKEANECEPKLFREKCVNDKRLSLIKELYYKGVVPILLILYRIDNFFPFFKDKPIEIWAVLKKEKFK